MVEKVSQADSNNSGLPNVPAVAPTSDTPYIQPVIGKLGYDTKHPEIFGLGSSPDNGASFHVWASFGGIVLDKDNMDAIWINGVSDRVKSEVNSATAEIPAVKSAVDEAVKKADSAIASSKVNSDAIANMKSAVSAVKSDASAAASDAIKNLYDVKSATASAYQELHSSVASNQVILDSTSKSLDGLATDLSKYAQDAVSQGKTIAQLQKSQDSVKTTVADVQGDVAQLKIDASSVGVTASNNKNDIASLKLSASSASLAIKDANSNAAVATATASQAYVGLQDAKSNIASVQATANELKGTVANAESDINQVKTDAQGMHEQITNANSQIATINTSVNGLQTSVNSFNSSVGELNKATQANSTAIEQNAKAIALKASQTSVNDLANSVNSQSASLTVMNNAISTKVTSADVEKAINGKGYVTKDFVESSITQKANTLSESIAKNDGQIQNITASIDGLQSTVKGKADISQVTQLSNALQSKVDSKDYQSKISQLGSDINARVTKGDLISQFNLEAGQTLIQSQKILLDGETVVFGEKEKAFIPSAMITNLNADKINAGTLSGVNLSINNDNDLTLINNDGVTNAGLVPNTTNRFITTRVNDGVITFGNTSLDNDKTSGNILVDPEGLTSQWEGKATIDKSNLYDSKYAVAQLDNQGTDLSQEIQDKLANKNGTVYKLSFFAKADNDQDKLLIDFNDAQGSQVLTTSYQQYVFNLSNKDDVDTARVIFSGIKDNKGTVYVTEPVLTRDLTPAELAVKAISGIGKTYDSSIFGNDGNLLESSKGTITIHAGDLLNDKSFWTSDGTWISKSIPPAEIKLNPNKNGSGAVTIQASGSVIDMNASSVSIFSALGDPAKGQGVQIEGLGIGGNTIWSDDDFFSVGSQRTGTYTYINVKGINYQSTLSSKTRIKRLDRKEALSTIMRDDIYTYLYKSDVQLGLTKRHASLVIDDENDVAQYRAPEEFISESGNARDDGTQLAYLIAAVQYQQEEIEELKKKLEEK